MTNIKHPGIPSHNGPPGLKEVISLWLYRSPIGPISIQLLPNGRYGLFYNGQCSGSYSSPIAAADDIYTHASGIFEWDLRQEDPVNDPAGLDEWDMC